MGYSPLQGLVMNTRCGDLDPGIIVDLVRHGYSAEDLNRFCITYALRFLFVFFEGNTKILKIRHCLVA